MNNKDKTSINKKILEDVDFIYCPRLGNSLKKLIEKNPDGIDEERIGKVLLMSQSEVEMWYSKAIEKIRKSLGVK